MCNRAEEVETNVAFCFTPNLVMSIIIPLESSSPNAGLKTSHAQYRQPKIHESQKKNIKHITDIDTTLCKAEYVLDIDMIPISKAQKDKFLWKDGVHRKT